MTIWMDLTNSLIVHQGKFVGIIRAELMQAKFLHQIDPSIHFSVVSSKGFRKVPRKDLVWLFNSQNIDKDYQKYQYNKNMYLRRICLKIKDKIEEKIFYIKRHYRDRSIPRNEFLLHPYKENDLIYSCGWFGTKKEEYFHNIKKNLIGLKVIYTIYDLVMVNKNIRHLYFPNDQLFDKYLHWISSNCDACVYCGHTAQVDAEKYFKEGKLRSPEGYWIEYAGNIIVQNNTKSNEVLRKYGIERPFVIAVGSFDHKKNYRILYQAFSLLAQKKTNEIPLLVIIGRKIENDELILEMKENPLTKENIKIINCSDEELDVFYKNCCFTLLPSLYEGYSVVLLEALNYGKLCVCSDVAPLREVGNNFAIFLDPYSPKAWANNIMDLMTNIDKIKKWEYKIKKEWKHTSWLESTKKLYTILSNIDMKSIKKPNVYYDLGLMFYTGGLTGIPRAQLLLARQLNAIRDDIAFFHMVKGSYYEISKDTLHNLLSDEKLDIAVTKDKNNCFLFKKPLPFKEGDIVFSAGVGYDQESYVCLSAAHNNIKFKYYSIIYDLTPITVPHTHPKERVEQYPDFLKSVYELSDFIFYGGQTAQKDGEIFQKNNNILVKKSSVIKFGSDFSSSSSSSYTEKTPSDFLKKNEISNNYILTVGTIEARKNQRILYEAYLIMQKRAQLKNDIPQIIICGHPGWKTNDFIHLLQVDNRIRGKVILLTPSDEELDILYRNCRFTALPSFYEGWSLTLPESLNYGKFCLAADTPSLREIGKNLVDYANPYAPEEWAEKIEYYIKNRTELCKKEKLIKQMWRNSTWAECAKSINSIFLKNE